MGVEVGVGVGPQLWNFFFFVGRDLDSNVGFQFLIEKDATIQ